MSRKRKYIPRYQKKFHVRTGDTVQVISGDEKGKQGTIIRMLREKDRAIVEGLNMVTRHVKPTQEKPEGGRERKEAGIHVSNLALLDPKTGEPTRIGRKIDEADGKKKRYSKKSGEFID